MAVVLSKTRLILLCTQTRGLPSVGASMRLATKSSSAVQHTLIAEVANFLRAPPGGAEATVRNSLGQISYSAEQAGEFLEVEDGGVKVAGLLMLGAAEPFSYRTGTGSSQLQQAELLAAATERVVGCFPVKFVDCREDCTTRPLMGQSSWLQPLTSSTEGTAALQAQLQQVMERFLCIISSSEQLERDLAESRKLIRSEAIEADKTGPRTISQVRRDRQRQEDSLQADGATSDSGNDSDSDLEELRAAAERPPRKEKPRARTVTAVSNPSSLAEIASNEALNQSVTVAMLWVCRWEGQLRWGLHTVPNMSFVGGAPFAAVGGALTRSKNPADFLMAGLHHPARVELCGAPPHLKNVPVRLSLKSVSDLPLVLTVEAVDEFGGSEAVGAVDKVPNTGVRWSGKTRHCALVLSPHTTTDLQMCAIVSQPGVFDLKRYVSALV